MSTTRLYYDDSYLTTFDAGITDRREGGLRIYLDRTAFYPTSGGQPHDTGTLNGIRVVEVVEEDGGIAHLLAEPLSGATVEARIDWERRHDFMQQHTGQHLLSAVIAERLGHATVSVHFGAESATLDLAVGTLTPAEVRQVERLANEVVTENRPVTTGFEDAAHAAGLRKVSQRTGMLRIVTITGLDRSACGGTHVRATGEIGPILIRKAERMKGQLRLEFLCGARAVQRAAADFELLSGMAAEASAGIDELPAVIAKLRGELKVAVGGRRELLTKVQQQQVRELHHAAIPDARGRRLLSISERVNSVEELRGLAQAAIELPTTIVTGFLADPATLLLATSADTGLDAGAILKPVLATLGGKGGGNPRLAQGSVPRDTDATRALAELANALATG